MYCSISVILSQRETVSVMMLSDSFFFSSYVRVPATSFSSSRRCSSFMVVRRFTLPCGTMLYGLEREKPALSSRLTTSVFVTCLRSRKYSSFLSPIWRLRTTSFSSIGKRRSVLSK